MRLTDVKSMQEVDTLYNEKFTSAIMPMEHAAKGVADVAMNILGRKARVVVICGRGNNGGDGFGAARWLHRYGQKVEVFGVGSSSSEALTEYNMLLESGVKVIVLKDQGDLDYLKMVVSRADLVIDALLGTGFTGELQDNYGLLTEIINMAACPVLSVDIPSGVNGTNGQAAAQAVRADYTVTMLRPKVGMLLQPAREYVGKVYVVDIGMPSGVLEQDRSQFYLVDREMARSWLPRRSENTHKGNYGRVAVLAGSKGFTGAAALTCRGAVKSGAGLVTLFTSNSVYNVLAAKLNEEMVRDLPDTEDGGLSPEGGELLSGFAKDVLALGPGLGRNKDTAAFVREQILRSQVPMVIDADALNALVGNMDVLLQNSQPKVLTPHDGEFCRLTGLSQGELAKNRLVYGVRFAKKWNVVLVLKGSTTLIILPDGKTYLVTSGSSAMATGGSGDVLTGIIASLMAQGLTAETAAALGCYWHGLAGSMATGGNPGLAAGEIADTLPKAREAILKDEKERNIINRGITVI